MLESSRRQPLTQQQPSPYDLPVEQSQKYIEYRYRWVIVALMGLMFTINGIANNAIIPVAKKLQSTYSVSQFQGNMPITISFLVYSVMNFPANQIIDKKGLRFSFLVGGSLYALGLFLYAMINKNYVFAIFGSVCVATGQPFIINCPAKVAAYWFVSKNRTVATAIMTGFSLIGTGIGYVMPTLVIKQSSSVEEAKDQAFYLYAGQFLVAAIGIFLVYMFMKKQPPTLPSIGAQQQKTGLKQSLKIIRNSKPVWIFFAAYFLLYGTLLSFGSIVNSFMKVYGFTDVQISLFAVLLIISGVVGAICWSLYLRKTLNYKFTIRAIPSSALVVLVLTCIFLNAYPKPAIIFVLGGLIGFTITPLMPISYDLGCQFCFPIGQAQVIGLLNGGAMILTFFLSLIITSAISFQTKTQSLIALIVFISIMGVGTILQYFVKIDLKRRYAQKLGHTVSISKVIGQSTADDSTEKNDEQFHENDRNQKRKARQVQIQLQDDNNLSGLIEDKQVYI